MFDTHEDMLMK